MSTICRAKSKLVGLSTVDQSEPATPERGGDASRALAQTELRNVALRVCMALPDLGLIEKEVTNVT